MDLKHSSWTVIYPVCPHNRLILQPPPPVSGRPPTTSGSPPSVDQHPKILAQTDVNCPVKSSIEFSPGWLSSSPAITASLGGGELSPGSSFAPEHFPTLPFHFSSAIPSQSTASSSPSLFTATSAISYPTPATLVHPRHIPRIVLKRRPRSLTQFPLWRSIKAWISVLCPRRLSRIFRPLWPLIPPSFQLRFSIIVPSLIVQLSPTQEFVFKNLFLVV